VKCDKIKTAVESVWFEEGQNSGRGVELRSKLQRERKRERGGRRYTQTGLGTRTGNRAADNDAGRLATESTAAAAESTKSRSIGADRSRERERESVCARQPSPPPLSLSLSLSSLSHSAGALLCSKPAKEREQ
jgi:hypothetical protein